MPPPAGLVRHCECVFIHSVLNIFNFFSNRLKPFKTQTQINKCVSPPENSPTVPNKGTISSSLFDYFSQKTITLNCGEFGQKQEKCFSKKGVINFGLLSGHLKSLVYRIWLAPSQKIVIKVTKINRLFSINPEIQTTGNLVKQRCQTYNNAGLFFDSCSLLNSLVFEGRPVLATAIFLHTLCLQLLGGVPRPTASS